MPEIRELDVLELWRRPPGTLDRWVRAAIACACAITIALAATGPRVLWGQTWDAAGDFVAHGQLDRSWFRNGLAVVAVGWIVASMVRRWRLSRYVRVAILLPLLHLALVAIAWVAWLQVSPRMPSITEWGSLIEDVPLGVALAAQLAVAFGLAWWIGRGRRESSHAFVMLALVDLLLVGLWVPIACWIRCRGATLDWWIDPSLALDQPVRLVVLALVPPLVAAAGYTALEIRHPAIARQWRGWALSIVVALFGIAIVVRSDASPAACVIYANLIPTMLATVIVAITAIGGLGIATWRTARGSRRELAGALQGVIIDDDPDDRVVACIEITSWLRGPRALVRPFVARTAAGELPILGARLAAPIDPTTTQIRAGEAVAVLRAGDRIAIAGLDRPSGDPFRTLAAPVAGTGVIVAPRDPGPYGLADVALATWRPAIAYLVILVVIAAPALAALCAART